jgi:hypothetical protein
MVPREKMLHSYIPNLDGDGDIPSDGYAGIGKETAINDQL